MWILGLKGLKQYLDFSIIFKTLKYSVGMVPGIKPMTSCYAIKLAHQFN